MQSNLNIARKEHGHCISPFFPQPLAKGSVACDLILKEVPQDKEFSRQCHNKCTDGSVKIPKHPMILPRCARRNFENECDVNRRIDTGNEHSNYSTDLCSANHASVARVNAIAVFICGVELVSATVLSSDASFLAPGLTPRAMASRFAVESHSWPQLAVAGLSQASGQ
jgi:hypothetical protein